MMKKPILTAVLLAAISGMTAQESADSLAVELHEVVVNSIPVIEKSDRKLIFPTAGQRRLSTDAADLLNRLQIPSLTFNRIKNTVGLADGGQLSVRLNGRAASVNDLKSIAPDDVVRVEWHESPSLRYGEVDRVVNVIVRQRKSGGNASLSAMQAFLGWGNYHGAVKVNSRRSQFGLSAGFDERYRFSVGRKNEEHFVAADGHVIERVENAAVVHPSELGTRWGTASEFTTPNLGLSLDYSYAVADKLLLLTQLNYHNGMDKTVYNSEINNRFTQRYQRIVDLEKSNTDRTSLNVYLQYEPSESGTLTIDAVAGYESASSGRGYLASEEYEIPSMPLPEVAADLSTDIDNRNYSLAVDGNYEHRFKAGRLTAGVRLSQQWGKSDYLSAQAANAERTAERKHISDIYLYAEWQQPIGKKLELTAGLGLKHHRYALAGSSETPAAGILPSVKLRYKFNGKHSLFASFRAKSANPTAYELSGAMQYIDEYQKYRGNPQLKPYMIYMGEIRHNYNGGRISGNVSVGYSHCDNPVMEEKRRVDDATGSYILNTVDNQRSLGGFSARLTTRVAVVEDWLSIGGSLGWQHFVSWGHRYRHTLGSPVVNWNVQLTHWGFTLEYSGQPTIKRLRGESITSSEKFQVLLLSYRRGNWQFGAGVFNLFSRYRLPSENLNSLAGYRREMRIGDAQNMAMLTVGYTIQWGRKRDAVRKRTNAGFDSHTVGTAGK